MCEEVRRRRTQGKSWLGSWFSRMVVGGSPRRLTASAQLLSSRRAGPRSCQLTAAVVDSCQLLRLAEALLAAQAPLKRAGLAATQAVPLLTLLLALLWSGQA